MLTEGQIKTLIKRHRKFIEREKKDLEDKQVASPQDNFRIGYSGIVVEVLEMVLKDDDYIEEAKDN